MVPDGQRSDLMRIFPIANMIAEFEKIGGITTLEKAIDCFQLPDGRMAQLTVKIETDGREWLNVSTDVQQAINESDARATEPDATLQQGAELAIMYLQENDQIPKWIKPAEAAKIIIGRHTNAEETEP